MSEGKQVVGRALSLVEISPNRNEGSRILGEKLILGKGYTECEMKLMADLQN